MKKSIHVIVILILISQLPIGQAKPKLLKKLLIHKQYKLSF